MEEEKEQETPEDVAVRERAEVIRRTAESELQDIQRERDIFRQLAEPKAPTK